MPNGSVTFKALSRRSFLESTAAAGALGLLGPSLLMPGIRPARAAGGDIISGSHWGAFHCSVEDGKPVNLRPWDDDPKPSHQIEGVLDTIFSPTRIKYPMVRREFLEKGPDADRTTRGNGDFVRVSWDDALDLVAKELKRVYDTHGQTAIFAGSYGWKSPGRLHNCQNVLRRMLNVAGLTFVNSSGDYSAGAGQIIMPHVVGTLEVYEQQTVWPLVIEEADLVVFWASDPIVTNQISWQVTDHAAYPWLQALKDKGTRVIFIDPVRTESAKFFDAEWIAPRPQTDVALMLGIAHTIVAENLHDQEFLTTYTTGFDKFLPYLMGESDGTPKTAEWAAEICEIPADRIKGLAREFTGGRTLLTAGWSMQRMHHGEQPHWMLVTLASMIGQVGLPGGGWGFSYHADNAGAPSADAPVLPGISDGGTGPAWATGSGAASIPCARVVDMLMNPGAEFDFNGTREKYPAVKLAYWVGGNPFVHHQERNRMVEAWRNLETFIVHDHQWTPTARHADIVLPATTTYERNDIEHLGDYSAAHILAMHKIIEPAFESRNDYDIFQAIAAKFGKEQEFTEGKDEMGWIKGFYEDALGQAAAGNIAMPDFDTFWNGKGVVDFQVTTGSSFVRYGAFREDPVLNPLGTPSGLIEIYSRNIEKMGYDDCPPHPTWMEPVERTGAPGAKFPLHIASSHPNSRLHSQLASTRLRETYAVNGREPCLINTQDAAARGIADGDIVRLFNDRGQILVGAKVTDDIRPGVVRVNEGGWYDPAEPGKPGTLCKYGDVNTLSVDIGTSKLAQGNCGHSVIGDVEKYTGPELAVTVFDPVDGST